MAKTTKNTHFVFVSNVDLSQLEIIDKIVSANENSYLNILYFFEKLPDKKMRFKINVLRESFYNRMLIKEIDLRTSSTIRSIKSILGMDKTDVDKKYDIYNKATQKFVKDYRPFAENEHYYVFGNTQRCKWIVGALKQQQIADRQISSFNLSEYDESYN